MRSAEAQDADSQALFLKPPEYLLCLMIFSRGVQSFCQKKLEPFGAKCPLRVLPGDTFAPCGQSRKSRRSCPGTTLCQGSQFGNTNATKLMHLMLYLFGQLAKLSIGAIRSIPCKMIQSRNIGICWYLLVFVVSVVSYQDVGYTVVFLFRKLLKLCVLPPWFQVIVEALLAKHGDLSAQDRKSVV